MSLIEEKKMFQSLFCDFKTGSMRRLPYLGYTVFLLVIAILLVLVIHILSSPGLDIIRGIAIIPIIIIMFAILYSSVVISAKRLRHIGIERARLYSILILGGSFLMEIIIRFSDQNAPMLTAIYYTTVFIVQGFLIFTPENFMNRFKKK